jgi:hypothetical protein
MTPTELSSGLSLDKDYAFPSCPDDPEMRESTSIWLVEENGAFAFPRCGVEAEAKCWDDRMFQANIAFAGGRVLIGPGRGAAHSPFGVEGKPTIIGAGPIRFECLEPFKRWAVRFDGEAADGDVRDQMAQSLDQNRRTPVKFDVELEMVTPAWVQETNKLDFAKLSAAEIADAESMGIGFRFEHLFRAVGTLEVDGETRAFKATGLRIKRQSARPLAGFRGHCWLSCLFPSGRAFGYIAYPPREDGSVSYNDGYIFDGGRMSPAKVKQAPWLRHVMPRGDDVSLLLESELGLTRIAGETVLSTFRVGNSDLPGTMHLQQSGVRYSWGEEVAYGMIERSDQANLITIG